MAWFTAHFFSEVLGLQTTAQVILPEADSGIGVSGAVWDGVSELPVLYLLHGSSDDSTIWMRRTSIDRYCAGRRLAVVIPEGAKSFFVDQTYGYRYFTYLTQELPEIMHRFFHISTAREDMSISGLSMGGYGCMLAGLRCPERYAKVASQSGPLDLYRFSLFPVFQRYCADAAYAEELKCSDPSMAAMMYELTLCFGTYEQWESSPWNLMRLLDQCDPRALPELRLFITTEDMLYETNQSFRAKLDALAVPYQYEEEAGIHEWSVWDREIVRVLDWVSPREQTRFENELSKRMHEGG